MAEDYPQLKIFTGPEEGKNHPLKAKAETRLGRADENELVLTDTSVSRHHCSVIYRDGFYFVKDVGSRNGTYINEEKVGVGQELKLFHLDNVRLGLYEIRFLERSYTDKELAEKDALNSGKVTPVKSAARETPQSENKEKEAAPVSEANDIIAGITDTSALNEEAKMAKEFSEPAPFRGGDNRLTLVFVVIAVVCALAGIIYFIWARNHEADDDTVIVDESATDTETDTDTDEKNGKIKTLFTGKNQDGKTGTQTSTSSDDSTSTQTDATSTGLVIKPGTDTKLTAQKPEFNVFLDIKTEPFAADIYLGEKYLGKAPLKISTEVRADESYDLFADFALRDLNDVYRKKVSFKVKPGTDVVEMKISGEIAELKILKLPTRNEFYLEGHYAYDKDKSNPVKIENIVYGRPIYMPYGKYIVELREKIRPSGSQAEIRQVRYQREYTLDEKNNRLEISVTDKDLQFFPAVIKSNPSNAEIYYEGEKLGSTPYSGMLPIGERKLKLVKEGYFDATLEINMQLNAVYETSVSLNTSKIGELINEAKALIRQERIEDALGKLVDALKYGGSPSEKAEVYFMLGDIYLSKKDYEQAKPYFEKARNEAEFKDMASLGLAKVYHNTSRDDLALPLIVEVLANVNANTPPHIKAAANSGFKQISPAKSVVYVYTEPSGASVYVNDKKLGQDAPLIISDLNMGNYRFEIQKPGFKTFKTSQNMKLGEFVLIKVQLEPEQF